MISDEKRKKRARPLVRWHGGKWMIANWILEFLPAHETYTEAFGGGASILLRKPRASMAEVYNDLDQTIVRIFKVLRDPAKAEQLKTLLRLTPYSREEFLAAYEPTDDPVEEVRRTLVRSWMGYGSDGTAGVYRTGFRSIVNHAGKTPASEWVNYRSSLDATIERIDGVTLESCDAFELLVRYDTEDTLHYVDPPYLTSTRSSGNRRRGAGYHVYQHELSEDDHVRLLELLNGLSGMVVLSGYPSALYEKHLVGWRREERAAFADGGSPRTEVIWINPRCAERLKEEQHYRDSHAPVLQFGS
ncbi:MAG: DNA adenine methylase [Pseudomonadota bacterium]